MKMKSIKLTIPAAVIYLLSSCAPKRASNPDYSGFISIDTANLMIESYQQSLASDSTLGPDTVPLNALIMDADELRTYLNEHQEITKVKIMFAHTMDYINAGNQGKLAGYQAGALTVVIAGYDKHENYVFAPGRMVPNHCIPCPDLCPTKGTAANNLLE